jgi:monoamine oxidase
LQPVESGAENKAWSQFSTRFSLDSGAAYSPWAFTEQGTLMAANTLRSEQAVHKSIYVV